jgi:DNA excision repair protein ERCC-2
VASALKPIRTVQVRQLVEFVLRTGDLGAERDFVGSNRAVAGTRGHQTIQKSRPEGYQSEVRVAYDIEVEELTLRIQGRIDGILPLGTGSLLEEIKTVEGRWDHTADPLHWAQARIYGFIYAAQHQLETITLRLTYLELETGVMTEFTEETATTQLRAFFEATTAVYTDWAREHELRGQRRDASIRVLAFPFPQYRPGQRELAVAAYRAIARGERLFAEAPTGIGKTISVLFPAVKALAEGKAERLFYLTARTTAREVAEKAMVDLRRSGLTLRSLTLTAKEKVCVQEGRPCDPQLCPLARGYYDRRRGAMRAVLAHEAITREVLDEVGREHQVCPFELSLDVSVWVDAVICDYNYVFDPQVYLRRHFSDGAGEHVLLVDEAHNLVDRGREMFSAELGVERLRDVRGALEGQLPRLAKALQKLSGAIRKLGNPGGGKQEISAIEFNPGLFDAAVAQEPLPGGGVGAGSPTFAQGRSGVCVYRELPSTIEPAVEGAIAQAEAWLTRNEPAAFREELLSLYFELFSMLRTIGRYDERYRTLVTPGRSPQLKLYCVDPSVLLRQAVERGRAAVFFSATLTPTEYYRELLGGQSGDTTLSLASPFDRANLAVLIHPGIRTHFKARVASLGAVVETIGTFVQARPGKYLIYLPSYQYLADVQRLFRQKYPAVPTLEQRPGMSEADRDTFLGAFAGGSEEMCVGFAVMGGIFGEGIDLVGDRLIGAVIVGVGLPQLSVERDLIRDHFQARIGAGFDYAYTFPGMNRVLQAIGRVIRSETDRGAVLLVDTRFGETRYRGLFPSWWQTQRVLTTAEIADALSTFWRRGAGQESCPWAT